MIYVKLIIMNNKPAYFDPTYNDESNLLENLYEFHPRHFSDLTTEELADSQEYYLFDTPTKMLPENVIAYRRELLQHNPSIESRAKEAYKKVIIKAGA